MTLTSAIVPALAILAGLAIGWLLRSLRASRERRAINKAWRQQAGEQKEELDRLGEQNAYLMEQITELRSESTAAKKRARELAESFQEANLRRKDLRRKIRAIRNDLEKVVAERNDLQESLEAGGHNPRASQDKDDKIFRLSRELESWQSKLPPLLQRYRERDAEALRLGEELAAARERIVELETAADTGVSVVEPVQHPGILTDGRDASNDTIDTERPNHARLIQEAEAERDIAGKGLRDNLQLIRGVGPAIEKTLNEMGIFRYRQIANMSEYDIDRVGTRLRGFHNRIHSENWIGQARDLDASGTSA